MKYFCYILTLSEKFTVTLTYIKHFFKFSRVGESDLSLDETKQYITKEGIRTDMDTYISCLR